MAERRAEVRQRLAQDIITHPGDYSVVDDFNRRHKRKQLRSGLAFERESSETLSDELRSTVYNFTLESTIHAARLSAVQVNVQTQMVDITRRLARGSEVPRGVFEGTSYSLKGQFPLALRAFSERLTGVISEATVGAGREEPALIYTRAKMNLLHSRARSIYKQLAVRGYGNIPPMPERLFVFEPGDIQLFSPTEREKILQDDIEPGEVVDRLLKTGYIEQDQRVDQDINGAFFTSVLFAANYAIEEKYPSISPRDATRLLLHNAELIGKISYLKLKQSLYAFTVTGDEQARGTFSWMTHLATKTQKMTLGDNNKLQIPFPRKSRGVCPISYSYEIHPARKAYFQQFNQELAERYNVQLPVSSSDNDLVLATQFSLISALYGEPLVNGRSHELIREYQHGRLGKVATTRFLEGL